MLPTPPACPGLPGLTPRVRVVILVIILTFIVVLAFLGYAPVLALGVVVTAMAAISDPRAALAAWGR